MKKRKTIRQSLRPRLRLKRWAIERHWSERQWRTEAMMLAELSKKYGVHPTQIGTWKRAAIENMAIAFTRRDRQMAELL